MTNYFCECCNSPRITRAVPYKRYEHVRCGECGYEHFSQSDTEIAAGLYENDADYVDDLQIVTNSDDLLLWHHQKAIRYLSANCNPGKTAVLDVGCFNGFFVKKLVAMGFDAHGIDFNNNAIVYGQEILGLGPRVSTSSLEQCIAKENRFDVITLFEVLEHLPEVKPFLNSLLQLLKEDGRIIISTPNANMCWRPPLDYPPHHVSRFTIQSLDACLSGFGLIKLLSAEQMSLFDLIRHYGGTHFRAENKNSLRGGEFKNKKLAAGLRRMMNRIRTMANLLLKPFDKTLHWFGVRYISQIIIARRHSS